MPAEPATTGSYIRTTLRQIHESLMQNSTTIQDILESSVGYINEDDIKYLEHLRDNNGEQSKQVAQILLNVIRGYNKPYIRQ